MKKVPTNRKEEARGRARVRVKVRLSFCRQWRDSRRELGLSLSPAASVMQLRRKKTKASSKRPNRLPQYSLAFDFGVLQFDIHEGQCSPEESCQVGMEPICLLSSSLQACRSLMATLPLSEILRAVSHLGQQVLSLMGRRANKHGTF